MIGDSKDSPSYQSFWQTHAHKIPVKNVTVKICNESYKVTKFESPDISIKESNGPSHLTPRSKVWDQVYNRREDAQASRANIIVPSSQQSTQVHGYTFHFGY
jgi:hypothetical protein